MRALIGLGLGLALVACKTTDRYPINPGGGGSGSGTHPDGGVDSDDGGGDQIAGRVCLTADARDLVGCAASGAGGITVSLGGAMVTTDDDGSFVIAKPTATSVVWAESGNGIVPGQMPYATITQLPAILQTTYDELLIAKVVTVPIGEGGILARVTAQGAAVPGATAVAIPVPDFGPYYEGTSATTWDGAATGAFGTVWIPAATGTTKLTITAGASSVDADGIPIVAGGLTFVVVELP